MRPRVFPAEDMPLYGRGLRLARASMRPRVFPAEDLAREPWCVMCLRLQ